MRKQPIDSDRENKSKKSLGKGSSGRDEGPRKR